MDSKSEIDLERPTHAWVSNRVSEYPKLETWPVAFLCEEPAFYSNFGKSGALCIAEPSNLKIDTLWVQAGQVIVVTIASKSRSFILRKAR